MVQTSKINLSDHCRCDLDAFLYFFLFVFKFFFLDVDHFLSLLNLLQYCFCFMFWFLGHEACGILASCPGIKRAPPALEGEVLTTEPPGKSPRSCIVEIEFLSYIRLRMPLTILKTMSAGSCNRTFSRTPLLTIKFQTMTLDQILIER